MIAPHIIEGNLALQVLRTGTEVHITYLFLPCKRVHHIAVEYHEVKFINLGTLHQDIQDGIFLVNIVVDIETDLVVIGLDGSESIWILCIDIAAPSLGIGHIAGALELAHTLHHQAVAVCGSGFEPVDADLVHITDYLIAETAQVVVLGTVFVIEMSPVVRRYLHPRDCIHI